MELPERLAENIRLIQNHHPLVHQITNQVTMQDCANITLAIGASPVMANAPEEAAEITAHAKALVLNLGTLQPRSAEAMLLAGKVAKAQGIPIVLDPVGVGATRLRRQTAARLLEECPPDIIRGNLAEIAALTGQTIASPGVDALKEVAQAAETAYRLAKKLRCIVAISGETDWIASPEKQPASLHNGVPMLRLVTGTGCMSSALIGCAAAVSSAWEAAITGLACMGIAGELAAANLTPSQGTGSFRTGLFDAVSTLTGATLRQHLRLQLSSTPGGA
nr:hydroxyethylthiazole kinase [uncultured Anaeromusa sp.]